MQISQWLVSITWQFHQAMGLLMDSVTSLWHIAGNPLIICETRTKWRIFGRRYIQMHFLEWKSLYFDSNFTEVCSQWFNSQCVSIGWCNGLAPSRQQAIMWTNEWPSHFLVTHYRKSIDNIEEPAIDHSTKLEKELLDIGFLVVCPFVHKTHSLQELSGLDITYGGHG